jgi:hypothetical protein
MAKAVSLLDCCEQFALRRTCAALVSPACRVELSDFAAQFTPDRRDRCADRPSQLDLGRLLLGLLLGVGGGRRHVAFQTHVDDDVAIVLGRSTWTPCG